MKHFKLAKLFLVVMMLSFAGSALAETKTLKVEVVDHLKREAMEDYILIILQGDDVVYETKALNKDPLNIKFEYDSVKNYELAVAKDDFTTYRFNLSNALSSGQIPKTIRLSLAKESQNFSFKGKVLDRVTNDPIKDCKITIINKNTGEKNEKVTGLDGTYNIKIVSGYEYNVTLQNREFLKRFASIDYCGDTLKENNKYCFKGFADISLDPNGGVSSSSSLMDRVVVGKKFEVDNIYYDYNKATLRKDGKPNVLKLFRILHDNPQIVVELGSHADSRGSDSYNMSLSQRRAESVVDFILAQGIDKSRIKPKGYGESILKNRCSNGVKCSNSEHEVNRRTEFVIIEIDESKIVID
ncbi:MAG: OmpA family protein [Thiotrichaceae bacterium]|nr:OmpA family protein [Thiotrichaceae bacterium]